MMFRVKDKSNGKLYRVYGVSYDKVGNPFFLVHNGKEWVNNEATCYLPIENKKECVCKPKFGTEMTQ